jgi:hypothetical protein
VRQGNTKKNGANLTNVWFIGVLVIMLLTVGSVEINPDPQMQVSMGRSHTCTVLRIARENKTNIDILQTTVQKYSNKIHQLSDTAT